LSIDLALDGEDRVHAPDRLDGKRRDDRQLAARFGGDVGQHEELAPRMRPARRLNAAGITHQKLSNIRS
jgi:hypothetical protein